MAEVERVQARVQGLARAAVETGRAAFASAALSVWERVQPPQPRAWVPSPAPSDNVQRSMNLVMPLRTRYLVQRGELLKALVGAADMIVTGLNNVGTVHFARFLLVDSNLCMISVYDGEFSGYIRDFVGTIGGAFDAVMSVVKDPPPTPVAEHPDEFIAWVTARDAFQFPDESTDLLPRLDRLERESLFALRQNRNVQLGLYRSYPGYSAAQVRQSLGLGW